MLERKDHNPVLYLHGRPSPHHAHAALAKALGSDFYPVDKFFRWQDTSKGIIFRIWSSLFNSIFYPLKEYKIVLVDNLHFAPIFCKYIKFWKKPKYAVHLGSHTLYFMKAGKFNKFVNYMHKWALSRYDIIVCEGQMARELVLELVPNTKAQVFVTFLGLNHQQLNDLNKLSYSCRSKNISIIAHGPGEFRKFYKGLDIMVKAFNLLNNDLKDLSLVIVGEWNDNIKEEVLQTVDLEKRSKIKFAGKVNGLGEIYRESILILHCSRGDAFPISTIESMASGVPVLVSNITGTKEIVEKVEPKLITTIDIVDICDHIKWFYKLDEVEKVKLSNKFKNIAANYSEENALQHYRDVFKEYLN